MADICENEKADVTEQSSESSLDKEDTIHDLLRNENDPDAGKSDEEKAAIVRLLHVI